MTVDRYMGIDPGNRWIGWCKLRIHDNKHYEASMGVFDRVPIAYTSAIDRLVPRGSTTVVCESFQNRPVGYNRFSSLETPQFIGGLKYAMMKADHLWCEAGPGNPDKDLDRLPIGRYIDRWMELCKGEERDTRWRHARAAWRVLSKYLMSMHSGHLARLARPKKLPEILVVQNGFMGLDIQAPTIEWTL